MKLSVVVKPNSKTDSIEKIGDEYVVRVKAQAMEGKANEAVVKVLAKHFRVPKTRVKLLRGITSRYKLFEI